MDLIALGEFAKAQKTLEKASVLAPEENTVVHGLVIVEIAQSGGKDRSDRLRQQIKDGNYAVFRTLYSLKSSILKLDIVDKVTSSIIKMAVSEFLKTPTDYESLHLLERECLDAGKPEHILLLWEAYANYREAELRLKVKNGVSPTIGDRNVLINAAMHLEDHSEKFKYPQGKERAALIEAFLENLPKSK